MSARTAKTLACSLTISRTQGGEHGDQRPIRISVEDEASRGVILELRISLADFAAALTGLGHSPAVAEVHPGSLARLGLKRQNRSVVLSAIQDRAAASKLSEEEWRSLIEIAWYVQEPHASDAGWQIFGLDKSPNGHRWKHGEGYSISLERWVDPGTGAPVRPIAARLELLAEQPEPVA